MTPTLSSADLCDGLVQVRSSATEAERRAVSRACHAGLLVRIAVGCYFAADLWQTLTPFQRHRVLIEAVALSVEGPIFAHQSAAVLVNLPLLDPPPPRVHIVVPPATGGRSTTLVVRHAVGLPDFPIVVDGHALTPVSRTVADLVATLPVDAGVVVADAALRRAFLDGGISEVELLRQLVLLELETVPVGHGRVRGEHVIRFASHLSGSPGESTSRVTMLRAGFPAPVLQHRFPRSGGGWWDVDFWWPDHGVIGESDGTVKYFDAELRAGLSAEQVVYREKRREDALRAMPEVKGFARWDFAEGRSVPRLTQKLRAAGLR
jgi:hypothetical protein